MVVLSIAPGIKSLAWSILSFPRRELRAECIECDLEHHGNKNFSIETFEDMLARARVHWLILTVLLERHPPAILALSSEGAGKELPEHVEASRCLLRTLFLSVGIPVLEFRGSEALDVLGADARRRSAVAAEVLGGLPTKCRPIVGTFIAGAASAKLVMEIPYDSRRVGGGGDGRVSGRALPSPTVASSAEAFCTSAITEGAKSSSNNNRPHGRRTKDAAKRDR